MSRRVARALAGGALVVAVSSLAGRARSDPSGDVRVTNVGASTLKVRVAEGGASVGDAHELWVGTVATETTVSLKTSQRCVWVEQTLVDASGPWSAAEKFCRPELCKGAGRSRFCEPIEGAPLKIDVDGRP